MISENMKMVEKPLYLTGSCPCWVAHLHCQFLIVEELVHLRSSFFPAEGVLRQRFQFLLQGNVVDGDVLQPADRRSLWTTDGGHGCARRDHTHFWVFSSISFFILEMLDFPDSTSEIALSRMALQLSVYKTGQTVFPQLSSDLRCPPGGRPTGPGCGPDLVLQPGAVLLLLLHFLLQPKSLLPGFPELHFGFPVVLRQSVQQVFSLRDGEIPFSDGLLVLCEFLGERRRWVCNRWCVSAACTK